MNRSTKVRHIFTELAETLGHTMPKHELLECAALIVKAYDEPIKNTAYLSEGRTPLCELPVNQVIEQWPWELMTEDYCARSEIDDALEDDYFDHVTQDFQLQQLITV
jgi:hypothetical protein